MPIESIQMERVSPGRSTGGDSSDTDCNDDQWQSPHDSRRHLTSPQSVVTSADENSNEQLLNLTTSHKRPSTDNAELEFRLYPVAPGAPDLAPRHSSDVNPASSTTYHPSEPRVRTQSATNLSDSPSSHSDVDEKPEISRAMRYPIASHYQAMLLSSSSLSASALRTQIPFPFFPVGSMPHPASNNVRPLVNGLAHSNALSNYLYPQFNPSHALAGVATTPGPATVGLPQQTPFPSFLCPPNFGMPPPIDVPMLANTPKRRRILSHPSKTESPDQEEPSLGQYSNVQPSTSIGAPLGGVPQGRDEAYAERRRKNNEAAKRSRDLRRIKEQETAVHARHLYEENIRLKVELQYLAQQLTILRSGYAGR